MVALATGAQLLELAQKSLTLEISKVFMWSDSTTVIKWCRCSDKQLQVFVKNRVATILEVSKNQPPYYVSTEENVADLASRGISRNEKEEFKRWKEVNDCFYK